MNKERRDRNVGLGVFYGILMAFLFSLAALAIYGIGGPEIFERNGVTLLQTIELYFFGGVIGGGIVGWLLPYSESHTGSTLVGVIGMFPVYMGVMLIIGDGSVEAYISAVIASTLVGGWCGHYFLYSAEP